MADILPAADPEASLLERRRAAIATLKAAGLEPKYGFYGGIEIRVKDAEQVAALLAAQETSRLRDAVARMVHLFYSDQHEFEFHSKGDGWNEPFSDTYACSCGQAIAHWTQTDPEHTGRPHPADMLLAWHAHVMTVYDACWCGRPDRPPPGGTGGQRR